MLDIEGPVEVSGKKLTVHRRVTLWADERGIDDQVRVSGENLEGLNIGIALRNLPNEKWTENTSEGYAMVNGDNNQPGYKSDGLGVVFDPSRFDRVININDEQGGHVYVLKGHGPLASHQHLAAIWDGDGQINNAADFQKYLERWSKLLYAPPTVQLADHAESHP
jgi:hypothetical protein